MNTPDYQPYVNAYVVDLLVFVFTTFWELYVRCVSEWVKYSNWLCWFKEIIFFTSLEFSANRQNCPHQSQKLVGSSKSFLVFEVLFGFVLCVFNFVYILYSIPFSTKLNFIFHFECCEGVCVVYATNDLLNMILLKIEYKSNKNSSNISIKRNETISIVISLFSEHKWMVEKKASDNATNNVIVIFIVYFSLFFGTFIWRKKK